MKIEVGMYVRTKSGVIDKIIEVKNEKAFFKDSTGKFEYMNNFKSSHNLIDLIEVGDYVNGLLVMSNDYNFDKPIKIFSNLRFGLEDIKSIVTKEQFKSVEYIVKE